MRPLRLQSAAPAPQLLTATVAALIALPGFASIKAGIVLIYLVYALLTTRTRFTGILIAGVVLTGLLTAWLLGLSSGVPAALILDHLSRLAIFFGVLMCADRLRPVFRRAEALDRLCVQSACAAALGKCLLLVLVLAYDVPIENLQLALGFETVTQSIGFGLQRLQFASDFVIAFLVACYVGGRSRWTDLLFLLAVSITVMLSFSRFIFVCLFLAVLIRALWVQRLDFLLRITIVVALCTLLIFQDTLIDRFISEGTDASDEIRIEQVTFLVKEVETAPWFGHGLGYSVPGYQRSESQPYSYEVQWYALLMQLGAIGCFGFAASIALTLFRATKTWRAALNVFALYLLWTASGFANPYLTSLGSALGFSICLWRVGHREGRAS